MKTEYLPKISIITPTLNQGKYIENTIVSVLSQNYPNLEYIIIDGGSTDASVDIIKKYSDRLAYWVSEPDKGHAHAINKGLSVSTGDILAYMNSDDYYMPGAFQRVANEYLRHHFDVICGRCNIVDEKGNILRVTGGGCYRLEEFLDFMYYSKAAIVQPEVFFSRSIFEKCGFFREDIYFVFDYEYWLRLAHKEALFGYIDQTFSCFRIHSRQKTCGNDIKINKDHVMVIEEYVNKYSSSINPQKIQKIKKNLSILRWHTDFLDLLDKRKFIEAVKKWIKYMAEGLPKSLISFYRWKKIFHILKALLI